MKFLQNSKEKIFRLVLIGLVLSVLIVAGELGYWWYLKIKTKQQNPQVAKKKESTSQPFPTPSPFKIIYGKDSENGRSIIYEGGEEQGYINQGYGVQKITSFGKTFPYKMICWFEKWEEIEGTNDRYLICTKPGTGEPMPKVRILKNRFNYEGLVFLPTVLAVEILQSEYPHHIKKIKNMSKIEWSFLNFLKKGDTVVVFFNRDKGRPLLDPNDNLVATWFYWRQENEKD
jgi:hypothetical protein